MAGDAARDRRDWAEAAASYRTHLDSARRDVAIWVQYGHALKESGQQAEAMEAYREATRLLPSQTDAQIALGQSLRIMGDTQGAIACFEAVVATTGDARALAELEREGIVPQAVRTTTSQRQRDTLIASLVTRCAGLTPYRLSDIRLDGDGLTLLSSDPWIEFRLDPAIDAPLALLEIEARPAGDGSPLDGQLYVDQGVGYEEHESVRFAREDGTMLLVMVAPASVRSLRWDPDRREGRLETPNLSLSPISTMAELDAAMARMGSAAGDPGQLRALLRTELSEQRDGVDGSLPALVSFDLDLDQNYAYWLLRHETLSRDDRAEIARLDASLAWRPRFSFVMPVYNTPPKLLRASIESMLAQSYRDFEICIADDRSTDPEIGAILADYAARDPRLRYVSRTFNGHISAASNSALALATGEFVVLVDHDDLIPDFALFVAAWYLNRNPEADILFSDEDKATIHGKRLQPYFKSCFNKYLMYGHNMISHLGIYRRALVEEIGGFRLGLEGSQDYDLFLRCYERSSDERIVHIPHILYHWRILPGSTAMSADQKGYAVYAAQSAINGHFERMGMPLRSVDGFAPGCTAVRPSQTDETPVSIIIPTRDRVDLLRPCIESIRTRPHEATEILIVDNGSSDPETLAYLQALEDGGAARVLRYPEPFNFSAINNMAASHASGRILCFLNNDTEIVSDDWLSRGRTFLSISEVGAVGARLLFPDGRLQHLGIVLGMGAHGIAGTPHGGTDGRSPGYFGKARLLQEVSAVTAACMFVRKADFDALGGFETELGVAYNDVDLCLRLRGKGLRILADPDITVVHKESRTRGSDKVGPRADRLEREAAWMRARWREALTDDPYFSPNLDISRFDFALGTPPRAPFPWQETRSARR